MPRKPLYSFILSGHPVDSGSEGRGFDSKRSGEKRRSASEVQLILPGVRNNNRTARVSGLFCYNAESVSPRHAESSVKGVRLVVPQKRNGERRRSLVKPDEVQPTATEWREMRERSDALSILLGVPPQKDCNYLYSRGLLVFRYSLNSFVQPNQIIRFHQIMINSSGTYRERI